VLVPGGSPAGEVAEEPGQSRRIGAAEVLELRPGLGGMNWLSNWATLDDGRSGLESRKVAHGQEWKVCNVCLMLKHPADQELSGSLKPPHLTLGSACGHWPGQH
jgi:hypothetical protein